MDGRIKINENSGLINWNAEWLCDRCNTCNGVIMNEEEFSLPRKDEDKKLHKIFVRTAPHK
jgi:hypothetical protein